MKLHKTILAIAALVPLAVGSACVPAEEDDDTDPTSSYIEVEANSISEDTTWGPGTYRITSRSFKVSGATLTIEPCTTIEVDDRFFVQEGGVIEAVGEEDCPVVFTSPNEPKTAGDWRYLRIRNSADNANVFEHVVFEYGGDSDGVVQTDAGVAFSNVTLRNIAERGITHNDGPLFDFSDMTFESVSGHPVNVHLSQVEAIDGITTSDVQNDTIRVHSLGFHESATWSPQSIPYELATKDFKISAELTIEAGTHLVMSAGGRGWVQDGGSLKVEGTEDDPVILESARSPGAASDWMYLGFRDSAQGSTLHWMTIRHAGSRSGFGAIEAQAPIEMNNVVFEDNEQCDVRDGDGLVTATDTSYIEC